MFKNKRLFYSIGTVFLSVFIFSFVSANRAMVSDNFFFRLQEEFADSTRIGKPGKNKLEIRKYERPDSVYAEILFYKKQNEDWILQQKEICLNTSPPALNVEIADFNNDGYNDFTYQPYAAGRGSNIIKELFIYDPVLNRMKYVEHSSSYPNLDYNKALDCLNSQAFYGGSTTSFLRIQGDSLFCFADISLYDKERTITTYNENGEIFILLNDTLGNPDYVYTRFSTYEPSEAIKEYDDLMNE